MPYGTLNADKVVNSDSITSGGLYGFKNRIINGDMRIDQRNAGASVTPTNSQYLVDRFYAGLTQASKFTVQRNAGSVTPPAGFSNYLGVTSSSAYSVLTGDTFYVGQAIEGFNVADFGWGAAGAAAVTLSFWVRSSLTGTFGGSLNNGSNRSYPFSYTISAANTWEQKTVTVPGDTTGTWNSTNGIGVIVWFGLGSGSTYTGTAGAWSSSLLVQPTGSTSVVGTNGATFYITGVQLEKGSTATSFDYRPYGTELMLCQRYFTNWVGDSSGTGFRAIGSGQCAATTTDMNIVIPLSVAMRANPTLSFAGTLTLLDSSATGSLTSIVTTYAASNQTVWGIFRASAATFTTGRAGIMYTLNGTTNSFSASAEL